MRSKTPQSFKLRKEERKMIVMIDNYDSFTYNLYQYIGQLHTDIKVFRNDEITLDEIEKLNPDAIIISPGPAFPKDAGISVDVIKRFAKSVPILGVCLGHQSIAEAFGGKVVVANRQLHGKSSGIKIDTVSPLFKGLKENITVARYHSLIVERSSLPDELLIIAEDSDGEIMALKHKDFNTYGVQFHPESILTSDGMTIIRNFLNNVVGIKTDADENKPLPDEQRVELKKYIQKVYEGSDLSESEAFDAMNIIMSDRATNAQSAAFLTALAIKGETADEITAFVKVMREKAAKIKGFEDSLDIVGTGGDLSNSFNISTTSSFVIAASGMTVAKHGNRSASSKSGAADCLEALGVKIQSTPESAAATLKELGMTFLFAPSYHSAMRFVGPVRKQIGVRTVFNILGPLINPASPKYMIMGVFSKDIMETVAEVLINVGVERGMVVYGNDKIDEISISDSTSVVEINNGETIKYEICPEQFGLKRADKSEVVGGEPQDNAKITLSVLSDEDKSARRDIVLLNAGCALYVTGKAKSITEGVKLAGELIDSGKALGKLNELIEYTNKVQ